MRFIFAILLLSGLANAGQFMVIKCTPDYSVPTSRVFATHGAAREWIEHNGLVDHTYAVVESDGVYKVNRSLTAIDQLPVVKGGPDWIMRFDGPPHTFIIDTSWTVFDSTVLIDPPWINRMIRPEGPQDQD